MRLCDATNRGRPVGTPIYQMESVRVASCLVAGLLCVTMWWWRGAHSGPYLGEKEQRLRTARALVGRYEQVQSCAIPAMPMAPPQMLPDRPNLHGAFIGYLCKSLDISEVGTHCLQKAMIDPVNMPYMSYSDWQETGLMQADILLLFDFIFANTPLPCAACKAFALGRGACPHTFGERHDGSVVPVVYDLCFAVYDHTSPVLHDWCVFVDAYYQKAVVLCEQVDVVDAGADYNSMF
jgi:hypothetical protein